MKKIRILTILLLLNTLLFHINAQKRILDDEAYGLWKEVDKQQISYDGKWVSYTVVPFDYEVAKNEMPITYLQQVKTGKVIELKQVETIQFFNKGKWVTYTVRANPNDNLGSDSTFIYHLASGKKIFWDRTFYCNFSQESPLIKYIYQVQSNNNDSYNRLVIYNIEKNDSIYFDHIGQYKLYNNEQNIIYSQDADEQTTLKYGSVSGSKKTIFTCNKGNLGNFMFNNKNSGGTFTARKGKENNGEFNLLYRFSFNGTPELIIDFNKNTLPDTNLKAMSQAYYLEEGDTLLIPYIGFKHPVYPKPNKLIKDAPKVDVWSWDEGTVDRRMKMIRGASPQPEMPAFVYHIPSKKFVKLTNGGKERLTKPQINNFKYVFISDPAPYEVAVDWQLYSHNDIYAVNVNTGERMLVAKDVLESPVSSPNEENFVWYNSDKKIWVKLDLSSGTCHYKDISSSIGYPVYDEAYDMPPYPLPYGLGGWVDNNSVIIYDRYDLWVVDLSGKKKTYSLSQGYGRQHHITFRFLQVDFNSDFDINKDIYLRSFNHETKAKGVYRIRDGKLQKLVDGDFNIHIDQFSGDGKSCLFTRESFEISPNIWWSDINFKKEIKLTDVNPQQNEYSWGTTQLVKWKNYEGKPCEGTLFLPENHEKGKTYPVIVNSYEIKTKDMHDYIFPLFSESSINVTAYVSKGYVVFQPDVHFEIGNPGNSAYSTIASGAEYLIEQGIADKNRIGIQGHSWGGYETAYLVTKTDMFRCAVPSAAVTNMTSKYGALRSNGLSSMFMFESGQSRMGQSMFDDVQGYIDNSPIFHVKDIHTPLLIFHNDDDITVPFEQGMSLFFAMRRLHKPAWMINYKGEGHSLDIRVNQIDWTHKMMDYFDYYLKDGPLPEWMGALEK